MASSNKNKAPSGVPELSDISAIETRTQFEEQHALILELKNRQADADLKIVEGEKHRKKLHNTILSTDHQIQGVLNLIDLAGSERLWGLGSGAIGDRLKETQAINESLSSLIDVIFALAKKDEHVPFRNSKLTYLLRPCLHGDSMTLMSVNIAPEPSSAGESLCLLRFGTPKASSHSETF